MSSSTSISRQRPGGSFSLGIQLLEERPGYLAFEATGKDAKGLLQEGGSHRWQQIPKSEKNGRVHTSTITVAAYEVKASSFSFDRRDVEFKTCRGSGAGGQHRNMTDSAVQAKHVPSGLMVRVESERSQHQNKESALALLEAKLSSAAEAKESADLNKQRKTQAGATGRAEKRRTVATQRDSVVDHLTGRETTAKRYLRGEIKGLWGG